MKTNKLRNQLARANVRNNVVIKCQFLNINKVIV